MKPDKQNVLKERMSSQFQRNRCPTMRPIFQSFVFWVPAWGRIDGQKEPTQTPAKTLYDYEHWNGQKIF